MKIKKFKYEEIFFFITIVLVLFTIITGSYLPMVDLPQHAAQVSTLDDILKDQSSWEDLVQINFLTPYLFGYFIWLIIYQFFDILLSSRIFLSLIFILFIYSINIVRSELNSTSLVTWIAVPSFFGFSYQWGFVTFLLSISIGLLFFFFNLRWLKDKKPYFGLVILMLGILLFFCHILSFLFFGLLSSIFILLKFKGIKEFCILSYPYLAFLIMLILYILQVDPLSDQYSYGMNIEYDNLESKLRNLMNYPWSMYGNHYIVSIFLLVFPYLSGFGVSRDIKKIIPLSVFLTVWFALPHFIHNTYFVYERYSILFFCFYYFIFEIKYFNKNNNIGLFLFFIAISYLLVQNYISISLAKKEARDFSEVIAKLPERKRALGLIFEPTSSSIGIPFTYIHYTSWYQAQKSGWSDFNFAWFHPQIVRYREELTPEVGPGFEWTPKNVQMLDNCDTYDLLFIRAYNSSFERLLLNSPCKTHKLFIQNGSWFIYRK